MPSSPGLTRTCRTAQTPRRRRPAPRDSFFVANASYVSSATGSPAIQDVLVRTNGSPPAVAAEVRQALGPASGAVVQDVRSQLKVTLSGLTAIDVAGLTRLELTF